MTLVARRFNRLLIALLISCGLSILPVSPVQAADKTTCTSYPDFPVPPETYLLPHSVCISKVERRGYRGYVTFETLREFQMAGRYFVTVKQVLLPGKKSRNYVNPLIKPGGLTNWYTPWISPLNIVPGIPVCATTWFRRTSKINEMVSRHCVTP